jgi:adenylosuccinate lyase
LRIAFASIKDVNPNLYDSLRDIYKSLLLKMRWIKETEKVTNHDVKAVEYFIKDLKN